ncbi:hypothetical protein [Haloferula sp.]|uniref:hypothetical protein n=1 Tax=Haloferula sp. TaxID=2497595 RepID=UPI00329FB8BF
MDPVEPWIDGNAVRRMAAQLLSSPSGSEIGDSPDAGFGPGFEGFTSGASSAESKLVAPEKTQSRELAPQVGPPTTQTVQQPSPRTEALPVPQVEPEPRVEIREAPVRAEPVRAEPVKEEPAKAEPVKEEPARAEPEAKPFLAAAAPNEQADPESELQNDQPFQRVSKPVSPNEGESKRGPLMERMLRFRDWLRRHAGASSVFVLDRDGQAVLDDPAYAKLHFLARSLSQAYRPVPGKPGNVHVKVGSDAYLVVIPVETAFGCLVLGTVLPRPLDAPSVEIVAKALVDASRPRGS